MIHAALPLDNPPACVDCHRNLVHSRPGPISSAEETKAIKRAADDSVHSSHLANLHLQKGMLCATCHGNDIILGSNPTAINTQCGACHGGIEQVAANFKGPANLNPHASQQGNTPCTTCHTGHQ
jgi:hypothetical protein